MVKKEKRFLDDIKKELAPIFVDSWHGKSGFKKIVKQKEQKPDYLKEKIEEAVERIEIKVEDFFKEMTIDKPRVLAEDKIRKTYEKFGKGEELLERLITVSDPDVRNQFNLLSGLTNKEFDAKTKKMNIDLILLNKKKVEEMIELKETDNDENPLYAMFQLIVYYFIFLRCNKKYKEYKYPDVARALKLTILAPKGYYQNHNSRPDNNEILKEISEIATESIRKGERKEDVIEFQRLDIDQEYLYDILISLEANFSLGKKIFRGKKIIE